MQDDRESQQDKIYQELRKKYKNNNVYLAVTSSN